MTILEELIEKKFTDPVYGMVSNNPHDPGQAYNCDNYWLFTAQAAMLGCDIPFVMPFYFDCRIVPGLFHRHPRHTDDISHDEIIGASTLRERIADSVYTYGWRHLWVFDAENPKRNSIKYCVARFINIIPYVKHCSGRYVWIVGQFMWSIGCLLSLIGKKDNTNGRMLMWVQVQKISGSYWLTDITIKIWKKRMIKLYPGGARELFTIYFGEAHPFGKHSYAWF